ncbi:hypothetical protein HanHA300_Chr03g0103371 [Helianthus annuus]|nr:hypothetical protein HanHA300_Chr03g0103371 [Helianthus annuus]KAJ0608992.1 hypothetical protein HanHA89_Chr03g0115041 [Helianthus annuus]
MRLRHSSQSQNNMGSSSEILARALCRPERVRNRSEAYGLSKHKNCC